MRTEEDPSPLSPSAPPARDPLAGRRILVGVCGGIAAVKVPLLVSRLVQMGAQVRCLLTPGAERLVSAASLACLSRHRCYRDEDQWDPIEPRPLHIELAEWADAVVVAPLTATSLSRWVHGSGEGLLASTLLACEAPVVVAAAMNTAMWTSDPVRRNWQVLGGMARVLPLGPSPGLLACDRVGDGRMAEPEVLILALQSLLAHGWQRDWQGLRLLVSAGPTVEPIDAARVISNRSSGRMGLMLAQAARFRGADVSLVHGPLQLPDALRDGLRCEAVDTAAEMDVALHRHQPEADAVVMAAAVADLRRAAPSPLKVPKRSLIDGWADGWEPVPDLLAGLVAARPPGQVLLGFAAGTGDVRETASLKHRRKGCDLLFANPIDQEGIGFAAPDNAGWLLGPGERCLELPRTGKLSLAHQLLTQLRRLLPTS
ncbi:bifunctional phosphopantothenoylcysteine decarboxylase/phosphopantothenate--cysteine ligase CoaBC [Synechococcus sp. RSCCF101]|uniref:bifunctional phosphopantothenoylcysteine decarboxylase/phosphopantothenate--cysteine ligase CoaBC n=1 Tax=Synechococcus sp. RSCCF101 TaxID=2511069 RepID=UPI001244C2EF|nr:bifunctional phosphopantothenoylcysteine decarboxylase/phosphopantothenate--cysteine ligase CoaBC [Synechococcus sp. RSCCF101]QEY32239.1 bifunctional phosphopantothenoylcysteine decarboxylase/phosphopantothenate--cysteine ligase CoaBC [Synechococcus sp. RSCCF101]